MISIYQIVHPVLVLSMERFYTGNQIAHPGIMLSVKRCIKKQKVHLVIKGFYYDPPDGRVD